MPPTPDAPTPDDTAAALASLEARVARIEAAVLRLTESVDQLPGLLGMAADAADEELTRLADRGVDVDARARQALALTEKLTRPEVLTTLERLTDQAVMLEGTVGMVGDIVDAASDRIQAETGVITDDRVRALTAVAVRLSDPRTLDTLQRLLDQADAFEGTLGMMLDIADDAAQRIGAETGTNTDDRVRALTALAVRASEPGTLQNLHKVMDQLDGAEGFVGMMMDMADDFVQSLATDDVDAEQRIQGLVTLGRRITEPRTLCLANRMLDRADALEQLIDVALAAPDTVGMLLDMWDEFLAQAEASGLELDTLVDSVTQVVSRAARLVGSSELQELIDSAVLDPGAVRAVGQAANALIEARSQPAGRAGMFKALGALSDPQVQSALDFAIRFGKAFGASVEQNARQLPDRT